MSKSYRPKYHASVPSGWANDPNGTIFYNGKAHLFFQHYPHKPEWGTMHWGHFTTTDFVHWTTLPVALVPDQDYEVLCGCCSGSAIEKDGKLYLIYTAAQPELQRQCLAVSEDGGVTFVKRQDNPILTAGMLSEEVSELDFRDPHLFMKDGLYYFVAGARWIDPATRKAGSPEAAAAAADARQRARRPQQMQARRQTAPRNAPYPCPPLPFASILPPGNTSGRSAARMRQLKLMRKAGLSPLLPTSSEIPKNLREKGTETSSSARAATCSIGNMSATCFTGSPNTRTTSMF